MAGRLMMLALITTLPLVGIFGQETKVISHLASYNMKWTACHPYLLEYAFQPFFSAGLILEQGSGDFRPAFESRRHSHLGFQSNSQKTINDWKLQGSFAYRKFLNQQKPYLLEQGFSPTIPFALVDEHSDTWDGDHINFSLIALSPIWQHNFRSHALIRYEVGSGNRNAEPRPLYRNSDLQIELGNSYYLNNSLQIGVSGSLAQVQEENSVGVFAVQDFSLYQLRGISTFTRNTFQSFQRAQKETSLGANAFLGYKKQRGWGFLVFNFQSGRYEARDGIAIPVDGGTVSLTKRTIQTGHHRELSAGRIVQIHTTWENTTSTAMDPIFKAVNFDFNQSSLRVSTGILNTNGMLRQIGINLLYTHENRTETAGRDVLDFKNLEYGIETNIVIPSNRKHVWWLKPSIAHRSNLQLVGSSEATGVARKIFEENLLYHGCRVFLTRLQANWMPEIQENRLNIGLAFESEMASQASFNQVQLSIGLLF